jgi:hypothetical protein
MITLLTEVIKMARINMDLTEVKTDGYRVLPEDWYAATVMDSELTESTTGKPMITWTWHLDSGRRLRDYVLIEAPSGQEKLKKMAQALGHPNPNFVGDSDELHGLRCLIKVVVKDGKNWINGFKPLHNSSQKGVADNETIPF